MRLRKIVPAFFLGIFLLALSSGLAQAAAVFVTGKAKVLNTDNSYLDFTNYNSNVTVDNATGNFSGYAFLEDLGWIAFGTTDNSLGPVNVNLTNGAVTGKAKSLNTSAYVDFTNYSSNVTANITTGVFTGYVFSEDMGWLNFSYTGVSASSTLDAVAPLSFDLDSPGDNNYTNSERPTFKWKSTTDATSGLSSYSIEVDNGDTGDFSLDSIPVSRTTDYETTKYLAHYENFSDSDSSNNYISAYSKSTTEWGDNNNDGKLKEGKRTWKVKAKDGVGNERIESRTLFVDRTGPSAAFIQVNSSPLADNLATLDTTPTIFGRVTDPLAGDKAENKVASGPRSVEIKLEKKNFSGLYDLHSLVTVNFTESYWSNTGAKITDNNKNTADKYSTFSFTPSESLGLGTYRVTITGKDNAGNTGASTSFSLRITTLAKIVPPEEKEVIEEVKEKPETVVEVPAEEAQAVQNFISQVFDNLRNIYWNVVDATKTDISYIASLWQGYADFMHITNQKALAFIGRQLIGAGQFIANSYNALAQKAPGAMGKTMLAFRNAVQTSADAIAYAFRSNAGTITDATKGGRETIVYYLSPAVRSVGQFAYSQQVKLLSIAEILFDKNPTVISNVKVAEVGKDYAVITWETNHYTTNNKINYGETLSYGQDVLSQERARHHEFKIIGLEGNKKYFFEVMSQNKNYVYDAHHEFTTLPE
ncbi:hypothetical protein KKH23_03305 [Patescibacteria group bacterium]|nr:hypothetical protein [Patescibacteria group bacterium]MBU0777035.1 hypothetical protein [Patescibacteria group bacterium]MBU0846193.1 hypothetical protein [Patescibacteria group bacterium]MBU0923106.1 hypothetical protein [Patescibacteria group bacterium]MBU1066562.1 hypothetical protein [Patescibacteria group bacterium]